MRVSSYKPRFIIKDIEIIEDSGYISCKENSEKTEYDLNDILNDKNILTEFANIKSDCDVLEFVKKYGFLGLPPNIAELEGRLLNEGYEVRLILQSNPSAMFCRMNYKEKISDIKMEALHIREIIDILSSKKIEYENINIEDIEWKDVTIDFDYNNSLEIAYDNQSKFGKEWVGIDYIKDDIDYAINEINAVLKTMPFHIWRGNFDELKSGFKVETLYQLMYVSLYKEYAAPNVDNENCRLDICKNKDCNKVFFVEHKNQKYCSSKCLSKMKQEKTDQARREKLKTLGIVDRVLHSLRDHIKNRYNFSGNITEQIKDEMYTEINCWEVRIYKGECEFNECVLELNNFFHNKCGCQSCLRKEGIATYFKNKWERKLGK